MSVNVPATCSVKGVVPFWNTLDDERGSEVLRTRYQSAVPAKANLSLRSGASESAVAERRNAMTVMFLRQVVATVTHPARMVETRRLPVVVGLVAVARAFWSRITELGGLQGRGRGGKRRQQKRTRDKGPSGPFVRHALFVDVAGSTLVSKLHDWTCPG